MRKEQDIFNELATLLAFGNRAASPMRHGLSVEKLGAMNPAHAAAV
jgi:hypothetical protein